MLSRGPGFVSGRIEDPGTRSDLVLRGSVANPHV